MNKKKQEEKRIKKGLLTIGEHMQKREAKNIKQWQKNKKNKGFAPFLK